MRAVKPHHGDAALRPEPALDTEKFRETANISRHAWPPAMLFWQDDSGAGRLDIAGMFPLFWVLPDLKIHASENTRLKIP